MERASAFLYLGRRQNPLRPHRGRPARLLRVFAQWYREGLIDPDVVTMRQTNVAQKMATGVSGASFGTIGSRMGNWIQTAGAAGTPINLVPTPYPVLKKGDKPKMSTTKLPFHPGQENHASIAATSKNKELAARLLDFAYGEAGHTLYNFGVAGESFNMVNGYPLFTDMILKNPNELTIDQASAIYTRAASGAPQLPDGRFQEQIQALQVQKDGARLWSIDDATNYVVPPISPTVEESQEFSRIVNKINTYRSEMEVTSNAWA